MDHIFKDLKIIELASVLAGPSVGMFFSELGAKVIKIENKNTGGDVTRTWKLPSENKSQKYSAYFSSINYKKEHLFLDLKDEDDYQHLISLIKEADIIISNFREKQAKSLKVDYQTISNFQPQIIFAQLTGFGINDTRPAFDVVLQAEAGFMYMNGEPNRLPVKMPVALIDVLSAHQMKEGILIALLKRHQSGFGSLVTTSLYDSAISSLVNQASNWLMAGHIAQPMGTLHPNIAPYGEMFETKDGIKIVLAVGSDKQFEDLCNSLQLNIHTDLKFKENTSRVINRKLLFEILMKCISTYTYHAVEELFYKKQIPFGRIRNMQEVFEQEQAQNMILEEKMEDGKISKRVKSIAFNIE